MKNIQSTRSLVALAALFLMSFGMNAQDIKKEIHIKTIENGVVTQDTAYIFTGDKPGIDHAVMREMHMAEMDMHHADMDKMHMEKKHVVMMKDSTGKDVSWNTDGDIHKEVKVIVRKGEGDEPDIESEVEEIWISKAGEGAPCKTIIIHEGDCPGMEMGNHVKMFKGEGTEGMEHMDHLKGPTDGEHPVMVEKRIIKTDDGEKVIIIESSGNSKPEATKEKENKPVKSKKGKETKNKEK